MHPKFSSLIKHNWPVLIGVVAGILLALCSCSSSKKNSSSSHSSIQSSDITQSSSVKGSSSDSTTQAKESAQFSRETVIEEFQGADQGDEILQDSAHFSAENIPQKPAKNIPSGQLVKRTTIRETGNFESQQTSKSGRRDTSASMEAGKKEVHQVDDHKANNSQTYRFPWGTIIFWGIIIALIVAVYLYLRQNNFFKWPFSK